MTQGVGIRAKLTLTTSALVACISLSIYVYFPGQFEQRAMAATVDKANTVAVTTAFGAAPLLMFGDVQSTREVFAGAVADDDLIYIVLTDVQGQVFASHGLAVALEADYREGDRITNDGTVYRVSAPVEHLGQTLGRLHIGLSLRAHREATAASRRVVAVMSLVVFALGIGVAFLVASFITRPLADVARAVEGVAAGDLSRRVVVSSTDELRDLAESFNAMAARLEVTRDELAVANDERSRLIQRILTIQEEEHAHIARELHDRAGQGLSSLLLGLRAQENKATTDTTKREIAGLRELTVETLDNIRHLAMEMRPSSLDHLGLAATLEQDLAQLGGRLGVAVGFHGYDTTGGRLPGDVEIALYRATHAALTNVALHSKANSVSVTVQQQGNRLAVIVEDDGVGFDVDAVLGQPVEGRFGLSAMVERLRPYGGRVDFESSPGAGATVFLSVPVATR